MNDVIIQDDGLNSSTRMLHIIYGLHALGLGLGAFGAATVLGSFLFGWPSIIAVVLSYIERSKVENTWLSSHIDWVIRTFWIALIWSLVVLVVASQRRGRAVLVIGAVATHAINPWLFKKMPYDPIHDFTPITGIASQTNKRSDELVTLIVNSIAAGPVATDINPGQSTFAYALDNVQDERTRALTAIREFVTEAFMDAPGGGAGAARHAVAHVARAQLHHVALAQIGRAHV